MASIYEEILKEIRAKTPQISTSGKPKKRSIPQIPQPKVTPTPAPKPAIEVRGAPAETGEFRVKPPKPPSYGQRVREPMAEARREAMHRRGIRVEAAAGEAQRVRGQPVHTPARHQIGVEIEKRLVKPVAPVTRAAPVTTEHAAKLTAKVSGTLRRAAGGVKMLGAGYWATKAARAVPGLGSVIARGAARKVAGPIGTALDVATTAQALYEGAKAAKSLYELEKTAKHAAERYGVRTRRKGTLALLREALTVPLVEMDPDIRVYSPKTGRWE